MLASPTGGAASPSRSCTPETVPWRRSVQKLLDRTSSCGVTVNGVFSHELENQLPFGGVGQSGMGSYHGYFGFKVFSHERAVYRRQ